MPTAPYPAQYHQYSEAELEVLHHYNDRIGAYLWAGIGAVILLSTVARLVGDLLSWRRRRVASEAVWSKQAPQHPIDAHAGQVSWSHVPAFLVSLFRKTAINQPRWLEALQMRDIGQNLLLLTYLALHLGLILGGSQLDTDWIAHYCAMLCFVNLPLIIGLAAKNNLISLVTGYTYESLNLLHRWSARVFLILSTVHVAGRIHVNVPNTDPAVGGAGYIRWGWAGWAAFVLLILGATRFLRNWNYQLFKASHIALVMTAMVSMLVHRPERYGWILAGLLLSWIELLVRCGSSTTTY